MWNQKVKSYQKRYKKYGVSPKALKYWNQKSLETRFRELLTEIDIEGKNILDFGCGFGDIISHLEKKSKNFSYTGVDIVPEFIEVATRHYPKHKFLLHNPLTNPIKQKFDIVIASGSLNSKLANPDKFRKSAIKILFDHAKEVFAFNIAGSHPQPKNKAKYSIYYSDSLKVFDYCSSLTPKAILRQNYFPKDFTIIMFR